MKSGKERKQIKYKNEAKLLNEVGEGEIGDIVCDLRRISTIKQLQFSSHVNQTERKVKKCTLRTKIRGKRHNKKQKGQKRDNRNSDKNQNYL